ncbi:MULTISPECIES: S-layer homology domain-containing protein [unclassified Moorena]|nr:MULTISPECIES: S-layer homology domain-containing protein [unclassified Moorena]
MRPITRAEVVALIYQALVAKGSADAIGRRPHYAIASPYIVNPNPDITSFTDIPGHWAEGFIRRLGSLNLISGFADGSFQPDAPLTRAECAALLVKVFDPNPIGPATQFIDVPLNFTGITSYQPILSWWFSLWIPRPNLPSSADLAPC